MKEIDWSQIRALTKREVSQALLKDGFFVKRTKGSHYQYAHPDGRRATIDFHHSGGTFRRKTLKSIIKSQAQWTQDDLKRLKLIK